MEDKPVTIPICGKRYMTTEQLADYLQVTPWTIYGWTNRREIPFSKIGPRSYRFDKDKIDEWMGSRTMKTVGEING